MATRETQTIDLAENASRCLEAWTAGDFETTRSLLSDDVSSDGPMGHTDGADAYVSGVSQIADAILGVQLRKTVVDGDDVCVMYDVLARDRSTLPTVNWFHFSGGRIDSVRAYFDPQPLNTPRAKTSPDIPLFAAALQVCEFD